MSGVGRPAGYHAAGTLALDRLPERHQGPVAAFHRGTYPAETRSGREAATRRVDGLLCDWCGCSRTPPTLCRCRW